MPRASYKINSQKLNIGPTNIEPEDPVSGEFKIPRGMSVIFPGVYLNADGVTVHNRTEKWTWDVLIEDEDTFNILQGLSCSGQNAIFETAYGDNINSPITYTGRIVDLSLDMIDGRVFSGNRRGYKAAMIVSVV